MSDFEKLINASDLIEWIIETDPDWCVGSVRCIIDHIDKMPSAQSTMGQVFDGDTVNRQAVIEAINKIFPADPMRDDYTQGITCGAALANIYVAQLPSAQPETHEERTETHACDYINRKDAIEAHYEYCNKHPDAGFPVWSLKILEDLPSTQPCTDQWCLDCKEYDKENDCCPRYNRVIRKTLDDAYRHGETEAEARFHAQQRWIPCSERLPEQPNPNPELEGKPLDIYLVCKQDNIPFRAFWNGRNFADGWTSLDVDAWMPLPKPYRAERRTDEVQRL